jgi:hypothetical protein
MILSISFTPCSTSHILPPEFGGVDSLYFRHICSLFFFGVVYSKIHTAADHCIIVRELHRIGKQAANRLAIVDALNGFSKQRRY